MTSKLGPKPTRREKAFGTKARMYLTAIAHYRPFGKLIRLLNFAHICGIKRNLVPILSFI